MVNIGVVSVVYGNGSKTQSATLLGFDDAEQFSACIRPINARMACHSQHLWIIDTEGLFEVVKIVRGFHVVL